MNIMNLPVCQTEKKEGKCGQPAIGLFNGKWRCGHCIETMSRNMQKLKEDILFTE